MGTNDTVIIKTAQGIVTSWPRSAQMLFGYTAAEMVGRPITRIFPSHRIAEEDDLLARVQRGERIERYQTTRRTKDGRFLNVSVSLIPIKDQWGNVVSALKTIHVLASEPTATPTQDPRPAGEQGDLDRRATIRGRIASGALPTEAPVMVSVTDGRGRCDACQLLILVAPGYVVDLPGSRVLRFHEPCLEVWHEECVEFRERPSA